MMWKQENIKKSLLWDITRRCNLNCLHCYNSGGISDGGGTFIAQDFEFIVKKISQIGINHIHLLGGEPLMAKGISDLLYYANKENIFISINTNGTLLDERLMAELIASNVAQLTISLDGVDEITNDVIRGSGNYKTVTENIIRANSIIQKMGSPMIIQVATVITHQNISTIHRMPRLLKNLGVRCLDVLHLYECGNAAKNLSGLQIEKKNYLEALSKIVIECYRNQVFAQLDCKPKVLELINARYGFRLGCVHSFSGCAAGEKFFFMDRKGNIYPCSPFAHEEKNTVLKTNIFDDNCVKHLREMEIGIKNRLNKYAVAKKPICISCQYNTCCNGCAICQKDYSALCETALQIFSKE